jgi:hypothetical protein
MDPGRRLHRVITVDRFITDVIDAIVRDAIVVSVFGGEKYFAAEP